MNNLANLKDDIWDNEIMNLLHKLRVNSILLSEKHKNKYYRYKSYSNYFDLPILILSAMSSPMSVGSQAYMPQEQISVLMCVVNLIIAIITSIKLYLNIATTLEKENKVSREFYVLSLDIYKMMTLPSHRRTENPLTYLNKVYNVYVKLLEQSTLIKRRFKQDRFVIDLDNTVYFTDDSSTASSSSKSEPTTPKNEIISRSTFPLTRYDANEIHIEMKNINDGKEDV